jgi:anhydro-N-acetylmuramic acid kinase
LPETTAEDGLYIGLMSGTSLDALDAALVEIAGGQLRLQATHSHPLASELRSGLHQLCSSGPDEIDRAGVVHRQLGAAFADAALALLTSHGIRPRHIRAIGCHGQTVRHRPDGGGFSLQLGSADMLAVRTGIPVVADFRNRDMVLGGQGAPLAPRFHQYLLARPQARIAVVNIGGMANLTLLDGDRLVGGFDTGPGNVLLNLWCEQNTGEPLDRDGAWARQGRCLPELLDALLADPYFQMPPPKSTGREYFHQAWLRQFPGVRSARPEDVQATLVELTVRAITDALGDFAPEQLHVCGGGAHNARLMERLAAHMDPVAVTDTRDSGIAPEWIEAAAFAWLAHARLAGIAGNAPVVTGAQHPAVLGALYPA